MSELKKCPFCCGQTVKSVYVADGKNRRLDIVYHCSKCGAEIRPKYAVLILVKRQEEE